LYFVNVDLPNSKRRWHCYIDKDKHLLLLT